MGNINLICIHDETKENIEDIILKVYENFLENELEKEFNRICNII